MSEKLENVAMEMVRNVDPSVPERYAQRNTFQRDINIKSLDFLQQTLRERPNGNQQFLDVGCGTGDFTREELLHRCQPCRRIVATEVMPQFIEYARKNYAHPQIIYEEHDIRCDVSALKAKYGKFDRVYSLFVLHWVQDQAAALRNIASLMKDDGDCVLVFSARTAARKLWQKLMELDRWKQYDEPSKRFIAKSQDMEDRAALLSYMRDTLQSANLYPHTCEVLTMVQTFENADRLFGIKGAVMPLLRLLPEESRKQLMADLDEVIDKFWTEKDPADPQYHIDTFVVHASKI